MRIETSIRPQADRDGGIQVTAGYMANGKRHGKHGQSEGKRHTQQADTDIRKGGGQYRTPASAEYQPECTDKFCR